MYVASGFSRTNDSLGRNSVRLKPDTTYAWKPR